MFSGMPILQKLRTMVSKAGVAPTTPAEFGFVIGARTHPADEVFDVELVEDQVVFTPATDGHLLLTGGPGTGKTLLLTALANAAASDMEVHTVDAWGSLEKTHALQPRAAATIGFTPSECATMLEVVLAEVRRRVQQCEMESVAAFGDLMDPPRRILVILDDTRHLLSDDDYSPAGDGQSKARSIECIEEIAEFAERAGVTFVFSSQWREGESGLPAKILDGAISRLNLRTTRYESLAGNSTRIVYRHGYWKPSGQPESMLVMQERQDERPPLGPAEPRGHVAAHGCC